MKSKDQELQALRDLKKIVYQILQEYEFLEPSGYQEDMICIPSRMILSLSRAYAAIGFCNNDR